VSTEPSATAPPLVVLGTTTSYGLPTTLLIHGTSLPDTELGKDLSNGCVRMPDSVILEIAKITPLLGTPVTITA
jgi:lipoprotein-anchoring transpeptidase ErfK/SrfK